MGITEAEDEIFGKLMRIPDELIAKYLRLCAGLPPEEADLIEAGLEDGSLKPNETKRRMARAIVDLYHGPGAGARAEDGFNRVHRDRGLPHVVPDVAIPDEAVEAGVIWLPRLLVSLGLASSNGEARRRIEQGGIRLNDEPLTDPGYEATREAFVGKILQVGRRWFGRLA